MRRSSWRLAFVAVIGGSGCAAEAPRAPAAPGATDTARAETPPPEPPVLRTLVAVPVNGFTGPGGRSFEIASRTSGSDALLHRQIGMRNFALPLRRSAPPLSQYPCATCHQGTALTARGSAPAHANVQPLHPRFAEGVCTTCHVTGSVERLALAGGTTTSLDHAYRLCAQCHFSQVNAWAAGAHGKRLVAWGGRRVVMSCADCHDPHRPGLESRLPFPGPRIRQASGASH